MTFSKFAGLVAARFSQLSQHELFVVGSDNRALEQVYLQAFPEGTNPLYKTNTEHDCACCNQFLRNLGNVVAIIDNKVQTVWDIEGAPHPYDVVAKTLAEAVRRLPITEVFRPLETHYGAVQTRAATADGVKTWHHFYGKVSSRHIDGSPYAAQGRYAANVQVMRRGLQELTSAALQAVMTLIHEGLIYRGEEHRAAVAGFNALRLEYLELPEAQRELFVWANARAPHGCIRNTAIGSLLVDLSEGRSEMEAVKAFEAKVAPENYKRPKALVTPAMVSSAMATISALGIEPSLARRHAAIRDVAITDVIWADSSAKALMKSPLENLLLRAAATPQNVPEGVPRCATTPTKTSAASPGSNG